MAKQKKPDHVVERDGFKVELRRRRDCVDADVTLVETGVTVEELEYPRLAAYDRAGLQAFGGEAIDIAKRRIEREKAAKNGS